jgi:hypothetical protein
VDAAGVAAAALVAEGVAAAVVAEDEEAGVVDFIGVVVSFSLELPEL